jgi:ATP-binding cassette subfamily B protein
MLKILRHYKPYLPTILLIVALLFIQANADLALPDYMSRIVNIGIQQSGIENATPDRLRQALMTQEYLGVDLRQLQNRYILKTGSLMLLLSLVSVAATVMVGYLGARTAAGLARDLRAKLFSSVEHFSFSEFDSFSTASLITRATNDVTQVQMVTVMAMRMFFYAPIIGIGGVIRATGKAASMSWIIALAVALIVGLIAGVFTIALPRFKKIQTLVDRLNLVVRENLSGMMVIRAFAAQGKETERFARANGDLSDTMLFISRVMVVMMPLIMLIMNLVSLLILWVGAHEVAASAMQIGDIMAFMQYAMQIFFSFIMLSMMFIMLPRASVSAERIAEVLEKKPSIVDPIRPEKFDAPEKAVVEFRDVCFRYPGATEDVLHDISFIASPGETIALIGTTGAGKSTLVSLIPRFYDSTSGSISIGGKDIRKLAQKDLRAQIGYVPQKSMLFSGTIESNLRYANEDAGTADLAAAIDIAQAREFVDSSPEGLAREISQGGANVSGGQRQRLAIARALARSVPIYIFDDSFSALDFRTDTKLRQALKTRLAGKTVFIVTQRVAAVKQADRILVLDEGRLVGAGSHKELMESCEVYRDIALSQLKQEELA